MLLSLALRIQVCAAAEPNVGYISYKMSLGENDDQIPLGSINIRLTSLGPDAYTPAALTFQSPSLSTEVEVIEDANVLRQIKTSIGIVDVVPASGSYEVRFYDRTAVGAKAKIYSINPGSIPYVAFRLANPGDEKGEPRFEITENRPGKPAGYTLFTYKNDHSWTMEKGVVREGRRVPDKRTNLLKSVINNQPVKISTSEEFAGISDSVVTVKCEYESNADSLYAGRLLSQDYPDGRRETYDYERGNYDSSVTPPIFTPSPEGLFMRTTLTLGRAVDKSPFIPFRSTRNTTVTEYKPHSDQDLLNVLLEVFSIYDGVEFRAVNITTNTYDEGGHLVRAMKDGRGIYSAIWYRDYKVSETDEAGVTTARTYDVYYKYRDVASKSDSVSETKTIKIGVPAIGSFPAQSDVVTIVAPQDDGVGSLNQNEQISGSLTDASTSSTSGVSKNYQITTSDRLGRKVRLERFAPSGAIIHEYFYNSHGQIKCERQTGSLDRLFEYDDFGELYRTGLDVKGTGTFDLSIDGSVKQTEMRYSQENGIWYRLNTESSCRGGKFLTTSITKERLTMPPTMLSQSIYIDGAGISMTHTTLVDRSKALVVEMMDPPVSGMPAARIIRNGLVQAEQSHPEQLVTADDPLSEKSDPWSKFVWDPERVSQLPYVAPQPSLTSEENRVFYEACIRLLKDSEVLELNQQLQALNQTLKTRMEEKLGQISPEAAKLHRELMNRQNQSSSRTTSEQSRPSAETRAILGQALRVVTSDKELIDIRKQMKIISEQRDELIEVRLEGIDPVAGILYKQIKEGFKNALSKG